MVAIVRVAGGKDYKKLFAGDLKSIDAGVKKRKYRGQKWTTVEVGNFAEDEDGVFSKPFLKPTSKTKKIIAKGVAEHVKKGKITKKTQKALNNIVVNPILAKKYGKNKPSTLEYKTGNTKWLNTGKFINAIEVLLKFK